MRLNIKLKSCKTCGKPIEQGHRCEGAMEGYQVHSNRIATDHHSKNVNYARDLIGKNILFLASGGQPDIVNTASDPNGHQNNEDYWKNLEKAGAWIETKLKEKPQNTGSSWQNKA